MASKTQLKIDWASHKAAKYAVEHWHYTKRMPVNKSAKLGVWEDGVFKGVIIFGVGASAQVHKQYSLERNEVAELVRVALTNHRVSVSRIVAIAIKMVAKANPKLKLIVSFADPSEGHHGGIYQAGNWFFTGTSQPTTEYFYKKKWRHTTRVYKWLKPEQVKQLKRREKVGKYRYVMPLDDEIRKRVSVLSKPYPKRVKRSSDAADFQLAEGGAEPTHTLQSSTES